MCEVCAIFGAGEHWSDFSRLRSVRYPFEDIVHYRAERKRRLAIVNDILARFDLTCQDWDGEAIAVHHASGRFKLAPTLNDLWPAAEELAGRKIIDPLTPDFAASGVKRFRAEAV